MNFITEHIQDFVSLFYPNICASCGHPLSKGEKVICSFCHFYLPKTNFHKERHNAMEKHFWGRAEIYRAASYFYFQRGSRVQQLIHQLKYRGKTEIGVMLGKMYGKELREQSDYDTLDLILPVPLHKSKEMRRGYNQVDFFCEGLSEGLQLPWLKNLLLRNRATETQTHKTRFERWKNVGSVFEINAPEKLEGKHVLLTDDVITTGSTLEACSHAILAIPGTTVSIVTIACAVK